MSARPYEVSDVINAVNHAYHNLLKRPQFGSAV